MKKIIVLTSIFAFAITTSYGQVHQKKIAGEYVTSMETECMGVELDGSQTLKVYGYGNSKNDAVEQAKKNAVRDVLFKGIIKGKNECNQKPVLNEVNCQEKHEDYFNAFFADGGKFLQFISMNDMPITLFSPGKNRKTALQGVTYGLTVIVKRSELKKAMIADGILVIEGQTIAPTTVPATTTTVVPATEGMRGNGDPLKGLNVSQVKPMVIGSYYALIIGIDNYKGTWPKLKNAVSDAKAVEDLLKSKYKMDYCKTLYNETATRTSIISELEWLQANAKPNDNVLIYYSGHGDYKKENEKGYWVPADASTNSVSGYISNNDLQSFLVGIKSTHTLLVSDACFSGDVMRGNTITVPFEESEKYYNTVHGKISRQAITSGSIEPVMDGGKEGHSVFTYYFLKTLNANTNKYFDSSQLFEQIKIPVVNNSDQTPQFNAIKNTGDEGGQFIFIKK